MGSAYSGTSHRRASLGLGGLGGFALGGSRSGGFSGSLGRSLVGQEFLLPSGHRLLGGFALGLVGAGALQQTFGDGVSHQAGQQFDAADGVIVGRNRVLNGVRVGVGVDDGDLMKRLQKMMPAHIEPAFKTGEELLAWQKEQGRLRSEALERENRAMKMQRTFNRSGIRPLHQNCSFDNYRVECEGQMNALARARQYVEEFDGNIASFIFSGKPGTGKNHLAAAICNELLLRGKSVLIITVADIMSAMKDTFGNRETSEEQLLNDLSMVDLLVIDEIGMQTESRYEKVIINQIVDRRSSSKRPTGMLTNSNMEEMNKLLGERVMDRMRLGNSLWVIFNWESYRHRVTGKEY